MSKVVEVGIGRPYFIRKDGFFKTLLAKPMKFDGDYVVVNSLGTTVGRFHGSIEELKEFLLSMKVERIFQLKNILATPQSFAKDLV